MNATAIESFYRTQSDTWPALSAAADAARRAPVRDLTVAGARVRLQWNPARLANATAAITPEAVAARVCRLCPDARPAAQRAFALDDGMVLLANPAPILPWHCTITTVDHRPQRAADAMPRLVGLARLLGPGWVSLYNGPGAGASIPEHLHLQAGHDSDLPLAHDVATWPCRDVGGAAILAEYRAGVLVLRDTNAAAIVGRAMMLLTRFPTPEAANALAWHDGARWTLALVPRRRHRPQRFTAAPPARLTTSPGALDVAGYVILPIEDEYHRITSTDVAEVFADVTYSATEITTALPPARSGCYGARP